MLRTSRIAPPLARATIATLALAVISYSSDAAAQTSPRIVGLTQNAPLVVSQDIGSCAPAQCTPAGMPAPPAGATFVGGSAYDSTTRALFVSDGLVIGKYDPRNACAQQCPVLPMPNTSPNNPVTGLAYNELTNTLYVTDQSGIIRWYTVGGGCQLSLVARCIAPIPSGAVLTGCATGDPGGLIFYCAATGGSPGGTVWVAQQGAPCMPFCKFNVATCGGNPMGFLRGLAYDSCKRTLWVTDGKNTVGLAVDVANCAVNEVQCCTNSVDPYIGLCLMPSTETSSGTSCTRPVCPACPTLQHLLGSEAVVGNPAFSLDLVNAPGQTNAFVILGLGPCTAGVLSPPLCGAIRTAFAPLPPLAAGPFGTGGTSGSCNGNVAFNLPLPNNPALCGASFCSQYIGTCVSPIGFGHYVSNALTWVVTSP